MEKIFKNNKDGSLLVSVAYAQADYAPVVNKVIEHLAQNVTIKGFRKGKAPLDRARPYIKNEDIYDGMVRKLIDRDFPGLLEEYEDKKEVANIQPSLEIAVDDKTGVYTFNYTFTYLPKAELGQYKGLGIKEDVQPVSDEEVDAKLEALRKDQAELVPSEGGSKLTDTVNIDFTGFIDNKPFDGGSAKNYDLVLGSNSFIPGFEDELVGLKEGSHKSFNITFPENYVASLAGKQARFDVTVNSVKSQVLPELDDEFAKGVEKYEVETLADLRAKVTEELTSSHATQAKNAKLLAVVDSIAANSKFVISDKYIEVTANNINDQKLNQIKQYGLGKKEYLELVGMTEEQFDADAKTQAQTEGKNFAVYRAVIAAENLEVSDDEIANVFGGKEKYDEFVAKAKEGSSAGQLTNYIAQIRSNLLNRKVEEFLLANN